MLPIYLKQLLETYLKYVYVVLVCGTNSSIITIQNLTIPTSATNIITSIPITDA